MSRILRTSTHWKQLSFQLIALFSFVITSAQNPIVTENALPGNPSSEWEISGAGDLSIQGFATDISVNKGQTVRFKINTNASAYTIDVYRLGYYNGNGARHVGTGTITATLPQTQPSPITETETGLVDCGNWSESAHWDVPETAVSGVYIARLNRIDNNGASHIVFIVRDDTSHADLLFQTSDATWQAYNVYGGNSLYVGATSLPSGHASKVSYNRPFLTRNGGGGGGAMEDWLFNAEYPMIRFLEKNGYNISYFTNVDAARHGSSILNHKIFLSVGHDEYWSKEQRNNVEAARNAGVHIAFFSGNEVYWKTRWENSTDGTNTAYRTLVCYKEGTSGENVCGTKCDPTAEWTGLWRSGCNYPAADGCKPENSLTGQIGWQHSTDAIKVPSDYKSFRFWRNTSIATLSGGYIATLPNGTLGYEWDGDQMDLFGDSYPNGRITLSSTTVDGSTHHLSLYRHSSGALVFGAGTVQWSWGLDNVHDRGNLPPSQDMQQATVNLFADMGVQPATLQPGLVPATESTDVNPPVAIISSPAHGATFTAFTPVTVTGTVTDTRTVAGVEVSTDGGITWKQASGTYNWSYTFSPSIVGVVTIKVRGYDDSGNMAVPGNAPSPDAITITTTDPVCPCTIFQLTDAPVVTNQYNYIEGIEVGVKFRPGINGYIRGLRFYKSTNDIGTHTGSLWTTGGTLIGRVIFTNESESGWQEVLFDTAVAVTANTTYVASYHSPTGYYAETNPYFTTAVVNGPLTAIAVTDSAGPNGIYKFSPSPAFPDVNYQSDNYWVDVVFQITATDVAAPVVVSTSPADHAIGVSVNTSLTITFNESVNEETVNGTSIELRNAFNELLPVAINYSQGSYRITVTPLSSLNSSSTYTLTIKGGESGIMDMAGNPLANDITRTFSTMDASILSFNNGPGGPILVISSSTNPFSRYAAEILRAEGLNEFAVMDISSVNATVLNNYDVVVLGEISVTAPEVTMLTNWVNAGGTLIAFKPVAALNSLMGLSPASGTLSDKYLLVNTASGPGAGIVGETIQFHGVANLHTLNGATSIATLYSDATTATVNPAVTTINVGSNGGKAIAFTYDLARSVVYTRQGNPAWAGQERDGQSGPIRSNDLFFGLPANTGADWIDFNKIAIPQADEQQRLLANIILQSNLHRKPLPRFWYLPRELKAAIVMTGDDHGVNGTTGRFEHYKTLGPNTPADVANWNAVRGTSYIFPYTPITNEQIVAFQNDGFEIALHPETGCANFTEASLTNNFTTQLNTLSANFPGISAPVTNRTHCLPWSDWASHAKVEAAKGIRLDANYYYWPGVWVQNRPGVFTGSGLPMRFADLDGSMIDCYQLPTQMTDESEIGVGTFCDALLDKALGPEGYYGAFNANMHTDTGANHVGSNAVILSAQARQVPVISAKQMLTWIDGRNNSYFGNIIWAGNELNFNITAASGSTNLRAMLPAYSGSDVLTEIRRGSIVIPFTFSVIKGIQYAFFDASVTANYTAHYGAATTTTITGQVTLQGRPPAPSVEWSVSVTVELYTTGNPTPVATFNTTTNTSGQFIVTGVPAGTFNIRVKSSHTLARVKTDQALLAGNNNIDFGILLEGDANNDNSVDLLDFSILLATYNKITGDTGYDARADFNGDEAVDLLDFSLLLLNYNVNGEENP
ncbi:MAG TPA: N,N-dimethylformamidase beta subunit family domain-containing protein [Chitinophagaceae bacterium]